MSVNDTDLSGAFVHIAWDVTVNNDPKGFFARSLQEKITNVVTDLRSQGFTVEHVYTIKTRDDGVFACLSPREREVLELLVQGKRAKQITEHYVLSMSTIRTHIRNILHKLNVGSQLEAVALFNDSGIAARDI